MKVLTQSQLVELLPADPKAVPAMLVAFEHFAPVEFRDGTFCLQAVNEGWTIPSIVSVDQIPAYLLTHHLTPDGGLWIDIAQTLRTGVPFEKMIDGVHLLAKQNKSRYVRFTTQRRGLVRLTQQFGWKPEAVQMVKGFK